MVLQMGYPEMDRAFPGIYVLKSNDSQYTANQGGMQAKGLKKPG